MAESWKEAWGAALTRTGLLISLIYMVIVGFAILTSMAQTPYVSEILYEVTLDPLDTTGLMKVTLTFTGIPEGYFVEYNIPLEIFISENPLGIQYLYYEAYPSDSSVSIISCNSICTVRTNATALSLYFNISNPLVELGIGAYSMEVNTTTVDITDNVKVRIDLFGVYDVYIAPKGAGRYVIGNNTTEIIIDGKKYAYITLAIATTQPPTGTPLPGSPSPQPPSGQRSLLGSDLLTVALIAGLVVLVAAFIYFLARRRVTVEVVTDVLSDELSRKIILEVGNAGNKGLTQAELVEKLKASKSSVSRKVKRLLQEGFVEVRRDGKYNYIVLTPKGMNAYKNILSKK
mgnify:CR=1 FL=1